MESYGAWLKDGICAPNLLAEGPMQKRLATDADHLAGSDCDTSREKTSVGRVYRLPLPPR